MYCFLIHSNWITVWWRGWPIYHCSCMIDVPKRVSCLFLLFLIYSIACRKVRPSTSVFEQHERCAYARIREVCGWLLYMRDQRMLLTSIMKISEVNICHAEVNLNPHVCRTSVGRLHTTTRMMEVRGWPKRMSVRSLHHLRTSNIHVKRR